MRSVLLLVLLALSLGARAQVSLGAAQLAVVVNDEDPDSVAVGALYRAARKLPEHNLIHVRLRHPGARLDAAQFRVLKDEIDSQLPPGIQAVLFVWTKPYAVECNALTAAYTLGLDHTLCARTCGPGQPNPYFDSRTRQPFSGAGLRLSMLLPTDSVAQAKALIARGLAADAKAPPAGAYYMTTSESARNSRAHLFPPAGRVAPRRLTIHRQQGDLLTGAQDVMIYETGLAQVGGLDRLQFLPGALADHLTSLGGDLDGSGQMSSLRWLEAGATATYGTVTEPCNYWQKFPHPTVLLKHYLAGETAIEAYWKSVAWPAQGLFLGEPLAAPYRR